MEIHIQLAGEQIGPFSAARVRQFLEEGLVAPTDLAMREGMEDWQPVEAVLAGLPEDEGEMNSTEQEGITVEKEATDTRSLRLPPRKIVMQTMGSSEPPPAAPPSKTKTGRTAIVIEPPRPTTHLPSVAGFVPKSKQSNKPVKTGYIALRDVPGQVPTAEPTPPVQSEPTSALPIELPKVEGDFEPPQFTEKKATEPVSRSFLIAAAIPVLILIVALVVVMTSQGKKKKREAQPGPPPAETAPAPSAPAADAKLGVNISDPKTGADFNARGKSRQDSGDVDGALADFDKAVSLDPKLADAYYHRGSARLVKGKLLDALADYNAALAINPKLADAYNNRGFIKQMGGDLDGALADYSLALKYNPKNAATHYNVGLIKMKKGDLDGAIADYDKTLDLDPKMAIAYYNRGVAKNTEGNTEGAMADYTQALTLAPNDPKLDVAYCNRGILRQSNGDIDGALSDYNHAIDLNPKVAIVYYNRGQIKTLKGDLDGAFADESQAIELDAKYGRAYCQRGIVRMAKGDTENGLNDLRKFCELTPRDPGADVARLYIWLLATQLNAHGTADQDLATALQNDWNSPPEELTSKLANFLLGHLREDALIANAASPDLNREPGQYCKAWYFAGMKRLLSGDKKTAIGYFQKAVATNQKDYCEYIFAQLELQRGNESASVAPKPTPAN